MRRLVPLFASMLLLGVPARSSAQDAHAEVARMRARMDSLEPRLRQWSRRDSVIRDSMRRAAQIEAATYPAATVSVGPFAVQGDRSIMRRAAPSFEKAWQRTRELFERSGTRIDHHTFILANYTLGDTLRNASGVYVLPDYDRETMDRVAMAALGTQLQTSLPPRVRPWMAGKLFGAEDLGVVARDLAFTGHSWLTVGDTQHVENRCLQRDYADCRALLSIEGGGRAAYVPMSLRISLVTWIAEHADSVAFARARSDSSDVRTALEHLGGAPIDTLISRWLDHVETARPRAFAGAGRFITTTLIWCAVFGALASGSTRWRLG